MGRLVGLETEYGLYVEGRGANDQIEDARELVAGASFGRPGLWDYRAESPRADLRGFSVRALQVDPEDAEFDRGRHHSPLEEQRADRFLPNGARFYNDHGHPEYATPECFDLDALVAADLEGDRWALQAARSFAEATGRETRLYKNNTDFHGASYGTHESYLVPRELGFDRLYRAVTPVLIARQILCGAGKVGAEHGKACAYQISQRADFFAEKAGVDTLYRRPVFNTRDEPHADPEKWLRLHVIAGDANMSPAATWRKCGLVRLAIALEEAGEAPCWNLRDPVRSFEAVSKDESMRFEIPLAGNSWTTAYEVLLSYLAAGLTLGIGGEESGRLATECVPILEGMASDPSPWAAEVDWVAKRAMLEQVMEETGFDWHSPEMRSYDLEFHNIDPEEGLYFALFPNGREATLDGANGTATRARARGLATAYPELTRASWGSLEFQIDGKAVRVPLDPEREFSHLQEGSDVVTFIESL